MEKVSVAILNWNGSALLRRYLPSVLAHSLVGDEPVPVYVVDNGSEDDSLEVLGREFPTVRVIALGGNFGYSGGYNRAMEEIDSEYVLLLNSDVETSEGYLQPLLERMESSRKVAACQPRILQERDHGRFEYAGAAGGYVDVLGYPFCRGRIFETLEADHDQYAQAQEILWASGAALMVRRSTYLAVGGLDEDFFAHMEEIDLCWRMASRGWKVMAEPASRIYHVGGATLSKQDSRKTYLNFRNNLFLLFKNLPSPRLRTVFMLRFLADMLASLVFLLKGQGGNAWAVIRARRDYYRMLPIMRAKRQENLREMKVPSPYGLAPYSILVHYHLLGHKVFSSLPRF